MWRHAHNHQCSLLLLCSSMYDIVPVQASTPGLYDGYCSDPLLRASAGQSLYADSRTEQYIFAFFTWCILLISSGMAVHLARCDRGRSARQVHHTLLALATRTSPRLSAIRNWHERCIADSVDLIIRKGEGCGWRRILFWLFHVPIALCTSLPAVGYVLSQK